MLIVVKSGCLRRGEMNDPALDWWHGSLLQDHQQHWQDTWNSEQNEEGRAGRRWWQTGDLVRRGGGQAGQDGGQLVTEERGSGLMVWVDWGGEGAMMGGLMDGAPAQGRPAGQISLHAHHCEHTRGMTTRSDQCLPLPIFGLHFGISASTKISRWSSPRQELGGINWVWWVGRCGCSNPLLIFNLSGKKWSVSPRCCTGLWSPLVMPITSLHLAFFPALMSARILLLRSSFLRVGLRKGKRYDICHNALSFYIWFKLDIFMLLRPLTGNKIITFNVI